MTSGWLHYCLWHTCKINSAFGILVLVLSTNLQADDESAHLKALPDRCVSLHQGQVCYQQITFSWKSSIAADYCLFQEATDQPLKCWENASHGSTEIDFQSDRPLDYRLHRVLNNQTVATSTVSISWVYKSSKRQRSNWRLF